MKSKLLVLLLTLICITTVSALEITPTRKIFDFKPAESIEGTFTVINSEHKALRLAISAKGELAEHIKLKDFVVDLQETDEQREFSYIIEMPDSFDKAGSHEAEIAVIAVPVQPRESDSFVGTSISLATKIRVRVPYPGKYAEASLAVSDTGESVKFVMPVSNLGTQAINSAVGTINVLGPTNERLATVQSVEQSIAPSTTKELTASWDGTKNPGNYVADATISYDGQTTRASKVFSVGNLVVRILRAEVKSFKLGGIAKVLLTIKSEWNQPVQNVYAELFVYTDPSEVNSVYDSKSTTISLSALATDTLPVYWDTRGLTSGTYVGKVVLHYSDRTVEEKFSFRIASDSFDAQLLSGKVTEAPAKNSLSWLPLVLVAVVVLIGLNIALFIYLRKTIGALKK